MGFRWPIGLIIFDVVNFGWWLLICPANARSQTWEWLGQWFANEKKKQRMVNFQGVVLRKYNNNSTSCSGGELRLVNFHLPAANQNLKLKENRLMHPHWPIRVVPESDKWRVKWYLPNSTILGLFIRGWHCIIVLRVPYLGAIMDNLL